MTCQRCSTLRGNPATLLVHSEILDLKVCVQCAKEAIEVGLSVEPLSDVAPKTELSVAA